MVDGERHIVRTRDRFGCRSTHADKARWCRYATNANRVSTTARYGTRCHPSHIVSVATWAFVLTGSWPDAEHCEREQVETEQDTEHEDGDQEPIQQAISHGAQADPAAHLGHALDACHVHAPERAAVVHIIEQGFTRFQHGQRHMTSARGTH